MTREIYGILWNPSAEPAGGSCVVQRQPGREILNSESWEASEIGSGSIGDRVYKAVQKHVNLIGRFQVTSFDSSVKENGSKAEQLLFDFYHEHKEQEFFDRICKMFGKKYDLAAYLYFIYDPNRYLPLRPSLFDKIFKKIGIPLETSGRCSWENYQEFLNTVAAVRNVMREYYQQEDVDLLDAHSFLWTLNQDVLNMPKNDTMSVEVATVKEKSVEIGAVVTHKDYGEEQSSKLQIKISMLILMGRKGYLRVWRLLKKST